jgi:hypothetical protein
LYSGRVADDLEVILNYCQQSISLSEEIHHLEVKPGYSLPQFYPSFFAAFCARALKQMGVPLNPKADSQGTVVIA